MIDPSFQEVNRLFVLLFENEGDRKVHMGYYLRKTEIKVMVDGKTLLISRVKNNIRTFDNIRKISTGQGDDYTTGYLLDYNYLKKYCKLIAIDSSKQQELDFDPKATNKLILLEI